jgi:hypothetical protein
MSFNGNGSAPFIGFVIKFGAVISTTPATDAGPDATFGTPDDVVTNYFPDPFGNITVSAPIGNLVKIGLSPLQTDPPFASNTSCFIFGPWTWPAPAVNSELFHTMTATASTNITAGNTLTIRAGACP